jgi:ATP-dependent exoDNAse (exonuclease V) alpha subunit
VSFYAATKKANEVMAQAYSHLYRLPVTGLRFFTIYGPWGRPDMAQDAANYQPVAGGRDGQEWYVANGEIGRVVAVSEKATVARFGGSDVPLVTIANKAKREVQVEEADAEAAAASDFDLAWAITVHRSQGSEWPAVVGLIDDAASQIADRNFWYTAISRARSACLLIGPRAVFDRQVKRAALTRRRTFLPELLKETNEPDQATEPPRQVDAGNHR